MEVVAGRGDEDRDSKLMKLKPLLLEARKIVFHFRFLKGHGLDIEAYTALLLERVRFLLKLRPSLSVAGPKLPPPCLTPSVKHNQAKPSKQAPTKPTNQAITPTNHAEESDELSELPRPPAFVRQHSDIEYFSRQHHVNVDELTLLFLRTPPTATLF